MMSNSLLSNTYGLVACGGKSTRMQQDKSMLSYYGQPQRYHVYEMLRPFCERVFISCNEQQVYSMKPGYNLLVDDPRYNNIGPMAGLLTGFDQFPDCNFLFIGCDYPFLTAAELGSFSRLCNDRAVAFYGEQAAVYEPLLAWYPAHCRDILQTMFAKQQYALQQFLRESHALRYNPVDPSCTRSIDSYGAYENALRLINS